MVDIHSHILPNIDDGAKSLDEAVKMARIAKEQGFRKIIATPHYIEGEMVAPPQKVLESIQTFNQILKKENMDLEVLPGNEVYISPNLPSLLKNKEILTLNNGPYVLIEFPMNDIPVYTEDILYEVRLLGYKPVIAHPERYGRIMENPNYLKRLIEQGNYVQMNSLSITGGFGERAKKTAEILIKQKMVHFIGTDAHSPRARSPKIKSALEQMKEWTTLEYIEEILSNGQALVNGADIVAPQPQTYEPTNGFFSIIGNLFSLKKKRVYGQEEVY